MSFKTRLSAFCDRLIEAGWLAAVVIVPLFFNVYSSRVFEPDKISTLRSIALVMVAAWLVKTAEQGLTSPNEEGGSRWDVRRWWQTIHQTPMALPTLAMVGIYIISTIFSVTPQVSFFGSYQRLQGTYSTLSYIVVFAMMLQGMRKKEQIERFVTVVILNSIPIALYGILQHYGLDPLPWGGNVRARVAGNMGNAIFIAAYLIMTFPLVLYRIVQSFNSILNSEKARPADMVLGAIYIFVLAIQAICIFFTQSRGPWLGLIGGIFFFFLVLAVVRRWRWLVWSAIIAMLLIAAFLVVFNLPNSPLEPLRQMPYIGRLGQSLDKEQNTSIVRLLIWRGAIELILPHPPLEKPDGSKDWMNWARPLIGYGPESMYVAYNRFYQSDLAHHEARNASPDRSHNETFDSLVITGLLGFVIYMWVFASAFYFGFKWLGVISGARQRNFFIACWIVGGILGGLVLALWQGVEFVGVGLPAGIAGGLGLYLVVWGLFLSRKTAPEDDADNPYRVLVMALVAAMLAHFVEIHFGIAIGATRTYFWAFVGLMVVVGYVLPRQWQAERQAQRIQAQRDQEHATIKGQRRPRRKSTPAVTAAADRQPFMAGWQDILPYALVLALILCTMAFDFVSNQKQITSPEQVLWTSLTRRIENKDLVPSYGILQMVLITWGLGSVIVVLEWLRRGHKGNWLRLIGMCLSVSGVIGLIFGLLVAGRLASVIGQKQLLDVNQMVMGMMSSYYVIVFMLIAGNALALLSESEIPKLFCQTAQAWSYPLLVIALVLLVVGSNLRIVHADIAYKQAEPYERQKAWDYSIVLHQQAISRAPSEDFYYLFLGRAFLEKARTAQVSQNAPHTFKMYEILQLTPQDMVGLSRDDLLNASDTVLQDARRINPLNTDHSANLGRLYRTRAELASTPADKEAFFDKSLQYYTQAVSLSPNAAHLLDEWGLVHFIMGEYQAAIDKYQQSLVIDDRYINTYLSLGDAYMATQDWAQAEQVYLQAVALNPNLPEVHSVLAYLYGRQERFSEAISQTQRVLELSTSNSTLRYNSLKNLAIYYQQTNQITQAIQAAQEALPLAPENERTSLQNLIFQLSGGTITPDTEALVQQYLSTGETALNNRQWAEAESAYQKALGLQPNLVAAHSALAYIYAQQGRLVEAEQQNQIVLSTIPGDFATLKNLAIIYRELKRYDDSISYANQAFQSPQASQDDKSQLQLFINEVQKLKTGG